MIQDPRNAPTGNGQMGDKGDGRGGGALVSPLFYLSFSLSVSIVVQDGWAVVGTASGVAFPTSIKRRQGAVLR